MRTSLSFFAVAALMTMAACSDDADFGNDTLAKPQPLVFVATQDAMTASDTRAAAADTWEGDGTEEIAIQIGTEVKKYKVIDKNGTLALDASTTPFYRSGKNNIDVKAWYPYSDTEPTTPTIATDQSKDQESSNLMTATATAVYGKSTTLTFSHQTARIRLHLCKEGSKTDDLIGATVKVKVTNADGSTQTTYAAHEDGDGYYSVLVASGSSIISGADFVRINDGNVGPYKSTAPADAIFEAGKSYTYNFNNLKSNPYITFSAASGQGFKMKLPTEDVDKLGIFEYSVGDGVWTKIASGMGYVTFGGSYGDLKLRGVSNVGTCTASAYDDTHSCSISFEKEDVPVAASGDIRTLVDYKNYKTVDTSSARFSFLFYGCKSLTSAPALPATTLAERCYHSMFKGCTSLTEAPELPATTLANECYYSMFEGTSLTEAPELPATTLAEYCCNNMFSGCTKLTKAPALPVTTLARYCYGYMFRGCTSLTEAPKLPATTLASSCYSRMFSGCTSLIEVPELPATTLASYCYSRMFSGCTSLTEAPELPVTTLAEGCYEGMFEGWSKLTEAPELPATTLTENCYNAMFKGCTSLTEAPKLPAETLANGCYWSMFEGTSLTEAPELPATTLAEYCYSDMFKGCTLLTEAPELPATTLAENCYERMFEGCSKVNSVTIKAESTVDYAFNNWLKGVASTGTIYKKLTLKLGNGASGIPSGWTVVEISE